MHRYSKYAGSQEPEPETECEQFICVPNKPPPVLDKTKPRTCPEASCPRGYAVVYEKMSMYKHQECPKYTCKPPAPEEAVCQRDGKNVHHVRQAGVQV